MTKECLPEKQDMIEIVVPARADYVSVVRLASSGISNRVGFDIDQIEDIKVAVAEVCNKIVLQDPNGESRYTVKFVLGKDKLTITFESGAAVHRNLFKDDNGLGISLIKALMDEVEAYSTGSRIIEMTKII